MDEEDAMKKILLWVVIGGFLGLATSYVTYGALKATSDEKFCVVCHEMIPMAIAYRKDVHGGAGKTGIKVDCVDCHLPHDSLVNYIYTKARNGVVEGYKHFFTDDFNKTSPYWLANMKHRARYVFDDGCIKCHPNYLTNEQFSKKAIEMHEHYVSLLDTENKIGCASCHLEVGHKGLKTVLQYYSPEFKLYERKAIKEVEKLEAEYFKEK